jgi:5-methylcytosine-specific restriction endonuclease McrA
MTRFLEALPTPENRWRAIVLLGRNTASYKFALGNALLHLARSPGDLIRLEDLALPFAQALCAHIREAPKQGTVNINRALREACEGFNAGTVTEDALRDVAVRHGFGDVLDAFHVLGGGSMNERFFLDERREAKGIRLTDELRKLAELRHRDDLMAEVEARWRVVETGWDLGVHAGLIEYDRESGNLLLRDKERRLALRSCRSTLNGYQKGKCFYCFGSITIEAGAETADVDHFFPWSVRDHFNQPNGIWNLVLACQTCNRGAAGKFDAVPALELLGRLHRRNEFYVDSKHKLATTIMAQTGSNEAARRSYLQETYTELTLVRIRKWQPAQQGDPAF